MTRAFCALLLCAVSAPVLAQGVVVSDAPVSTSVTVYRDPDRGEGRIDPRWPNGYALISEKRRITLPAGAATVRFEGVAGGMIAVSAVVTGLPGGVDEKNRDARLLSPAALLDGSLGNRVHLRRTNRKTGKVSEQDAIIRSGPSGAVVLQSAEGVEALRCSGLPETIVYDAVPEGLTAKPSFTVHTTSPGATTAEVTLTYLATGFDWGASYIAKVAEDGKTLDLFAWLTVANGNDVIYPDAQLLAVAGAPNRQSDYGALVPQPPSPVLNLQCWPMDSTSTHDAWGLPVPPSPVMYDMVMSAPASMAEMRMKGGVMATANRIAKQEELGDLKLYRVPMPVEVAPNGQKQVALLQKADVPFTRFYGAEVSAWETIADRPLDLTLRMQNKAKDGLGVPLPSGGAVVMQRGDEADLLLADTQLHDYAVGEKVELNAGAADQVRMKQEIVSSTGSERRIRITLSNALDRAAPVELLIGSAGSWVVEGDAARLPAKKDGKLWAVTLKPNSTATLNYTLRDPG